MKKKLLATVGTVLGLSLLLTINAPTSTKADSNLLLASVEWVQAQLNPLQTKVASLEKQVAQQDATIKQLQKAVADGGTVVVPPVTTNPPTGTPAVIYTTTSAKVHSGATRSYKVISTIVADKGLTVIGEHKGADGKGWIFSGDVSTTKPGNFVPSKVITKEATNVRKGATTNYTSLETVAKGSTLTYLGSFKNANGETWYNVQTPKGNKGWVLSTLTEVK